MDVHCSWVVKIFAYTTTNVTHFFVYCGAKNNILAFCLHHCKCFNIVYLDFCYNNHVNIHSYYNFVFYF